MFSLLFVDKQIVTDGDRESYSKKTRKRIVFEDVGSSSKRSLVKSNKAVHQNLMNHTTHAIREFLYISPLDKDGISVIFAKAFKNYPFSSFFTI